MSSDVAPAGALRNVPSLVATTTAGSAPPRARCQVTRSLPGSRGTVTPETAGASWASIQAL